MKLRKYIFSTLFTFVFLAFFVKQVNASEGIFELRNRVGEDARCVAYSVLMQDLNYNILLSCRDILYPGGTSVFSYVVWAVPSTGGNQFRLGTIGLGKASFKTKTPFSSLFVTKETNGNARTPSGTTIMQGSLEINTLLDGSNSTSSTNNTTQLETPTPSPVATPAPRSLGRIFAAGGILAFIAIFGVILVVFFITKK